MKGKLSNILSGVSRPSPVVSGAVRAWLLYEPVAADRQSAHSQNIRRRPTSAAAVHGLKAGQPTTPPRKRRSGRVKGVLTPDNTYRYY